MFAVIKTGGKQYRVAADDQFTIERIAGEAGDSISFTDVLMVGTTIGAPLVAGASVVAEIVDHVRGPKVISFKKRRRQNSKRTRGHRQDLTLVRISEILTEGQAPSKKEKKATKPAAAETDTVGDAAQESEAPKADKAKKAPAKAKSAAGDDAATAKEAAGEAKKPRPSKKKDENGDKA